MTRTVISFVLALVCSWSTARAAVIVVDTLQDDAVTNGNCTLREAIQAANTNSSIDGCGPGNSTGTDTILVSLSGTVTITLGTLPVTEAVIVQGSGMDQLTLSATGRGFEVVMASPTHDFTLQDLTVADCNGGFGIGGAVLLENVDVARFNRVRFRDNRAAEGGAIGVGVQDVDVVGEIQVNACEFLHNVADAGGVLDDGGALMESSTVSKILRGTRLTISDTLFRDNYARHYGGAILFGATPDRPVEIRSSTFLGNQTGNTTGALYLYSDDNGTEPWRVENSSFFWNGHNTITVWRVDLRLVSSTLWRNSSPFLSGDPATTVIYLGHSILGEPSGNVVWGVCAQDLPLVSEGYNLVADGTCFLSGTGDSEHSHSGLSGIEGIGGPLPVAIPGPASPAVDGGSPSGCPDAAGNPLTVDQRGHLRPEDGDGDGQAVCDIGSVEIMESEKRLFFDGFELGNTWMWSTESVSW